MLDRLPRAGGTPRAAAGRQSGFALIAVIWIAGLLAVAATALSATIRSHVLYGRSVVSGTQAQAAADGLLRLLAWQLTAARRDAGRAFDGRWQSCRWGDVLASISIQDQSGLIDINTASPDLMRAVLSGLGLPEEGAAALEMAIEDFRDADRMSVLGGAEPVNYTARPYGPKNAPFAVVEELDQIPGITPQILSRLMPLTTVQSQQMGFSSAVAPAPLLASLHMTRAAAAASSYNTPSASSVLSVTAAVELPDGARFVRQAILAPIRQASRPYEIQSWTAPAWIAGRAPNPVQDTACESIWGASRL